MLKFSRKKGTALPEYMLIAALFAVTLGLAIFQMSPDLFRTYFEKSISNSATTDGNGRLTLPVMGE